MRSENNLNSVLLQALVTDIRQCINDKKVDVSSAVALVAKTMEAAHRHMSGQEGILKREYVVLALSEIAKGKDGISGTEDDLIPPATTAALKLMVENDLLTQTINTICDALKGRITFQEVAVPVTRNCFMMCMDWGMRPPNKTLK